MPLKEHQNQKYLQIDLIKYIQAFCNEAIKYLSDIEGDLNKQKDIPCSWVGRFNIVKMTVISKSIHISNTILF
jgi:hypothetical protein